MIAWGASGELVPGRALRGAFHWSHGIRLRPTRGPRGSEFESISLQSVSLQSRQITRCMLYVTRKPLDGSVVTASLFVMPGQ